MLTEIERRRLQEQGLGECWHEWVDDSDEGFPVCQKCNCRLYHVRDNRTFTTAQDYEDLLEKVVRPNVWLFMPFIYTSYGETHLTSYDCEVWVWFLTLSIEERNKIIHDFGMEVKGWKK